MQRARFLPWWFALWASCLICGCDDRYADAVVLQPPNDGEPPDAGEQETTQTSGGIGSGGAPVDSATFPRVGTDFSLCDLCETHSDCGGHGDLCLTIAGEGRCGLECSGEFDCPWNYDCMTVDDSDTRQCVPERGTCQAQSLELDEARSYILQVVNDLRLRRDLKPLRSSSCLDDIGQQAVVELETEGTFKTKYYRECVDLVPNCDCNWQDESQAWTNTFSRSWQDAIDYIFERAASDPQGSFFVNVSSKEWERIGIGVLLDDDYLRFSLEFAP